MISSVWLVTDLCFMRRHSLSPRHHCYYYFFFFVIVNVIDVTDIGFNHYYYYYFCLLLLLLFCVLYCFISLSLYLFSMPKLLCWQKSICVSIIVDVVNIFIETTLTELISKMIFFCETFYWFQLPRYYWKHATFEINTRMFYYS